MADSRDGAKDIKPWPARYEQQAFERERAVGIHSFFRTSRCKVCAKEIPKNFEYCSQACWNKLNKKPEQPKEES